ncbi:unnamed protein product [Rotaria sp. Silwood1]|nr:unnamed protein product [Rotaria sp. Silwood1]CAF0935302.1 unnamed protein product [Rotaria sp. Silwood1]CAF3343065.1 unnamed protein product [Rotaria sp. Silwood1]CAF3370581.1 unnamed protein product [Rotaria sp. Silwood1]CAF4570653.1 unnamed protein product [Rotaria sp. Silwood1]
MKCAQLCHSKYQEDITKDEFNLLTERIANQNCSLSCELSEETFFNIINKENIRGKLHDQHRSVAQPTKEDMIQSSLSSAECQMDRYRKQFNSQLK